MGKHDNPAYEYAASITPQPEPEEVPVTPYTDLATAFHLFFCVVSDAIQDPQDAFIIILALRGHQRSEIARRTHLSRQTVDNRLKTIAARHCMIAQALRISSNMTGHDIMNGTPNMTKHDKPRQT